MSDIMKGLPSLGFGTYRLRGSAVCSPLKQALLHPSKAYKLVDSAEGYRNSPEVSQTISEILASNPNFKRSDITIVSKLGPPSQGDASKAAIEQILNDFASLLPLDLLLIHWPGTAKIQPSAKENAVNRLKTWQNMEEYVKSGKITSIGVSNYTLEHLQELWQNCTIKPSNLQIELHPINWQDQKPLVEWCHEHGISVTAYSSFGVGELFKQQVLPELDDICSSHNKTKSQVLLRWAIQHGIKVIPKASTPERISENADCLDWTLDDESMQILDNVGLDESRRQKFCWDPKIVL